MKHAGELVGVEFPARDARVSVRYNLLVRPDADRIEAELINVSSDGFRLRCEEPLESGGVFAEPVAL